MLESSFSHEESTNEYSIVPLSFLRMHSIPYTEKSFKNKSITGFVERFINLEKYIISRTNTSYNWLFRNTKQLGIVNHILFEKFIKSLIEKDKNFHKIVLEENSKLEMISKDDVLTGLQITINSQYVEFPNSKIIVSGSIFENKFAFDSFSKEKIIYKYIFKIDEVLSDSVNHYFISDSTDNSQINLITILPCSNFSIIEYCTYKNVENPLSNKESAFLEENFDVSIDKLNLIKKDITYKKISFTNKLGLKIIPDEFSLSFPIHSSLFLSLVYTFGISSAIDNHNVTEYFQSVQNIANTYSKFISLVLGEQKEDFNNKFGKLLNAKDIGYINFASMQYLKLKFNFKFKSISLTVTDFKNFLVLLTNSIDYKNKDY